MALPQPPTRPISIRLTKEERARLTADAGGKSLSAHAREKLLGCDLRLKPIRTPSPEAREIAQVLAALGHSEIAASLRDLSQAVADGLLPLDEETQELLKSACEAVHQLRDELIGALGLRQRGTE